MLAKIQIRRDNTQNWSTIDPTLLLGEIGYETNTNKFKIGDGVNSWNALPYQLGQWISDSYGNISYGENPNENDVIIKNNLKVGGDLSVKGTTTFVNTKEMVINDRVITLNWNLDDPARYDGQLVSGIEVNAGANWEYDITDNDPDNDYKTLFANGIVESFEYDSVNNETKLNLGSLTSRKMSGTVSLFLNSKNVNGIGTSFLSQVDVGSKVLIDGELYTVGNVFSDTSLSLTSNSTKNSSNVDIFTDYIGLSNIWPQNYFNNKVIFLGDKDNHIAFPVKRYDKDSDNDPPNPKIILDGDVNKIDYEIYTEIDGVIFADDYVINRSDNFTYKNDTNQDETEIILERAIANWPQDYNYQDEDGQTRKFIKLNKVDFLIKEHRLRHDGDYELVLHGNATTILPSNVFQIHKNKKQFYWTNDILNKGWHLDDDFFVDGVVESKNSWEVTPDLKDLYRSRGSVGIGTPGPLPNYVFDVKDVSTQTFKLSIERLYIYDEGVQQFQEFDGTEFAEGSEVTQIINFEGIVGNVVSWESPPGENGVLKVQSQYIFESGNIKNNGGTEFVVTEITEVVNTGDTQVLLRSDNNVYLKLFSDETGSIQDTESSINLQFYDRELNNTGLKSTIQWDEATKTFRINYGVSSNKHLILDEDGKVGIGTDTPISLLELAEPTSGSTLKVNLKDNELLPFEVVQGSDNYIKVVTTDGEEKIVLGNKNTDPDIVFDTDGLIDIPTTLAVDALKVGQLEGDKWSDKLFKHFGIAAKTSNYGVALGIEQITDDSDSDTETEMWGMGVNSDSDLGFFKNSDISGFYDISPDAQGFTLPTPSIIFKSDGKVGIGTTTPTQRLQVAGNIKGDGTLEIDGATNLNSTLDVLGVTTLNQNLIINSLPSGQPAVQKFSVMSETGNTDIEGTLDVLGDVKVNTDKFVVTAETGNTDIKGDLKVNGDKLVVTAESGNTNIKGTLDVINATTLSSTLDVTNATTLSSTLDVEGDVKVKTNKFVVTAASGNTDIAGTLDVTDATTLSSTLGVTGATTLHSSLDVTSDTTLKKDLKVKTIESGVYVDKFVVTAESGDTDIKGTLDVTNATTLSSTLDVTGSTTLNSTLNVTDDTTLKSDLKVTTIESGNPVDKFVVTAASGDTDIAGTLDVEGDLKVKTDKFVVTAESGNTDIAGTLNVTDDTTLKSDLKVTTIESGNPVDKFVVTSETGNTDIAGTLNVTDATTLDSTLNVAGDADLDGTLDVEGDLKVKTNKFVVTAESGNTDIAGTLNVSEGTVLSSTLDVTGTTTLASLDVSENLDLEGTLDVEGDLKVKTNKFVVTAETGNTDIKGDLKVNGDKFVVTAASGNTDIEGTLNVTDATTLSSTLDVTDATTLSSTLDVTDATTLSSTLDVTDATTLSSTLDVTGDLKVKTDKFVITAETGNTNIAGDLGVGITLPSDKVHIDGALRVSDSWSGINTQSGILDYNANTTRIITHGDGTDRGGFQVISKKADGSGTITPLSIDEDGNVDFSGSINANNGVVFGGSTSTESGTIRYNGSSWEGYNGSSWIEFAQVASIGGTHMTETAPTNPLVGDFWWDTSDGTLRVYYADGDSTQWVTVTSASSDALDNTSDTWLKEPNNDINYPDGNVGIGTTIPGSKLEISGSPYVLTNSGKSFGGIHLRTENLRSNGEYTNAISFSHQNHTASSSISGVVTGGDGDNLGLSFITHPSSTGVHDAVEAMRINHLGNVGIGHQSPDNKLDVRGATSSWNVPIGAFTNNHNNTTNGENSYPVLRLARVGSTNVSYGNAVDFGVSRYEESGIDSRTQLDISLSHTTSSTASVMSLRSDGFLGIGKTSPSHPELKLEVDGKIHASDGIHVLDRRADGDITPINWPHRSISTFFTDKISNSPNVWDSGITVSGWDNTSYKVWQLFSNSEFSNENSSDDLYFRTGSASSWGTLQKVWTDANLDPSTMGGSASSYISDTAPTDPEHGDFWWDSDYGELRIYYTDADGTSQWVTISGGSSGGSSPWTTSGSDIYYNTGKVGIGDSSPDSSLDINVPASTAGFMLSYNNAAPVATTAFQVNAETNDDSRNIAQFASLNEGTRMTIRADGNVGIGTTSPSARLSIDVPSYNVNNIVPTISAGYNTTSTGWTSVAMGYISNASGNWSTAIGNQTTASGQASTAMGNQTTASGSNSTSAGYYTNASGHYSTAMGRNITVSGQNSFGIGLDIPLSNHVLSQSNTMAIMGGNVGIGTTSPSATFMVSNSTSNQATSRFQNTHSSGYSGVEFLDSSGNVDLYFGLEQNSSNGTRLNCVNGDLTIYRSGTPTAVFDSSGRVGIGTTSPTNVLSVNGRADFDRIVLNNAYQAGTENWIISTGDTGTIAGSSGYTHNGGIGLFANATYHSSGNFSLQDTSKLSASAITVQDDGHIRFATVDGLSSTTNVKLLASYTRMTISPSGSVGIGTTPFSFTSSNTGHTTPGLHIANTTSLTSNKVVDSFSTVLIEDSESRLQLIGANSGSYATSITLSSVDPNLNNAGNRVQSNWSLIHRTTENGDANKFQIAHQDIESDINHGDVGGYSSVKHLTIDTSGNVGIGNTCQSPSAKLEVGGNLQLDANNASLYLKSGAAGTTGKVYWTYNTDTSIYGSLGLDYDTRTTLGMHLDSGYPITLDSASYIDFSVNGTNKMRMDSDGSLNFNTANTNKIVFNDNSSYWLSTGPAENWGIYWNTVDNKIEFHGNGSNKLDIDLNNGNLQVDGQISEGGMTLTSKVSTWMNRGYVSATVASDNLPVGWYTIATNTGNRATARFGIWDNQSSRHQSVTFYAAHHFGTNESNTLTVLDNSNYGTADPFRHIRIKDGDVYDGAVLQVYIDNASNSVNVAILGDNFQSSGWVVKNWIPDATDPGDVDDYSSMVETAKVDLDLIRQGGFATTGEIYAGGNGVAGSYLNKVYHEGTKNITVRGVTEKFQTHSSGGTTVSVDLNTNHYKLHHVSGLSGNFTVDIDNIGLSDGEATNISLMVQQGATAYIPNELYIAHDSNSPSQLITINWQGGSAPSGTAGAVDIFSFTILNLPSTSGYKVLGNMVSFS